MAESLEHWACLLVSGPSLCRKSSGAGISLFRVSEALGWGQSKLKLRLEHGRYSLGAGRARLVCAQASKRQFWKDESSVRGKATRRAMQIIKEVRTWIGGDMDDDILLGKLDKWVKGCSPERRDWLDVLYEFDTVAGREVLLKLSEWSLKQRWFKANARDYTKLIERYGKARKDTDAERVYEEMEAQNLVDLVTLTVLVRLYGKARQLDKAVKMFETAKERGFRPDSKAYSALMVAYGYSALPREAELVLEEMRAAGLVVHSENYCAVINGYGRLKQGSEARRVFDLMLSRDVKVTLKVFTALLDAYRRSGDLESAKVVFDSLSANGFTPDDRAVALLISAYQKSNLPENPDGSDKVKEAVGKVVALENAGVKVGAESYTNLLGLFGKMGLLSQAEDVFSEMQRKEMQMSPKTYAFMYEAYRKAGEEGKAKEFADSLESKGLEVSLSGVHFNVVPIAYA